MLKKLIQKFRKRWYVDHVDLENDQVAYFGPFKKSELMVVMNDDFAEALASCGPLTEFQMTDAEASKYYINTRAYWLEQAADLTDD